VATKLKARKIGKRWWIVGDEEPIGPYDSRKEANEAKERLIEFEECENVPGYVTSESRRRT
jgi:hypothetical protein